MKKGFVAITLAIAICGTIAVGAIGYLLCDVANQNGGDSWVEEAAVAEGWYKEEEVEGITEEMAEEFSKQMSKKMEEAILGDNSEQWFKNDLAKAENGDVEAMLYVAQCLINGSGCDKDQDAGVDWYKKAAEQGNSWAMLQLGCYYEYRDACEAVKWFKKAMSGNGSEYIVKTSEERSDNIIQSLQNKADNGDEQAKEELDKIKKILGE